MGIPTGFRLFNRTAHALIGKRGQALEPASQVRLKFHLEKISGEAANRGTIDFYNLNKSSRSILEHGDGKVELHAGYGGNEKLVMQGDVFFALTKRVGPDIITSVDVRDGGTVRQQCIVSYSLGPGSTNRQVVDICVAAMRRTDPTLKVGNVQAIPLVVYNKTQADNARVSSIMDRIVRQVGWTWFILDGEINVVPVTKQASGSVFLLTPDTGLIEVPSKDSIGFDGSDPLYRFKSLLNPLINPNDFIRVESSYVEPGIYKVYTVTHSGDTHEGEYATLIEAG